MSSAWVVPTIFDANQKSLSELAAAARRMAERARAGEVTLACDHRILYGADAARFLTRVREHLEDPAGLAT